MNRIRAGRSYATPRSCRSPCPHSFFSTCRTACDCDLGRLLRHDDLFGSEPTIESFEHTPALFESLLEKDLLHARRRVGDFNPEACLVDLGEKLGKVATTLIVGDNEADPDIPSITPEIATETVGSEADLASERRIWVDATLRNNHTFTSNYGELTDGDFTS